MLRSFALAALVAGACGKSPIPGVAQAAAAVSGGTIAYTRNGELRVIEPDGSGDRALWVAPPVPQQPDLTYHVNGPAWRPDGAEIAFSSDHEQAFSPYDSDIYIVGADGKNLRKLTHAPGRDKLRDYPKGKVTVHVQLLGFGPIFVILQGAAQAKMVSAGGTVTFDEVADLGDGLQQVVASNGADRWLGLGADVKAGKTVDAGLLTVSPRGGIPGYRAEAPFWRSDGKKVGFLGPLCSPSQLPAGAPPLSAELPLVSLDPGSRLCALDWGPTAATASLLAMGTVGFDEEGRTLLYLVTEGAKKLPPPIASFDNYRRLTDLHWLPSGTGFVVARQDDLTDEDINLHLVEVPSGKTRQLTDFSGEQKLRRFTISPDGGSIVFERTTDLLFGKSDLWIAKIDGSGARKLVADGGSPAWNPTKKTPR